MPFLTCHGVDIHWQQSGDGSPVVLVHGFGESCERLWEQSFEGASFVDALVAGGHRAVRFDLRGHGRSTLSRDQSDYVIEKLVDDVAAVVREADADDAHFVGFSLGAELAFRYLLRRHGLAPGRVKEMMHAIRHEYVVTVIRQLPHTGGLIDSDRRLIRIALRQLARSAARA